MAHKILVADDEVSIANTLALILRRTGHEAASAYDGESALKLCAEFVPDLLMTDMVMPGMSGIELIIAACHQLTRCRFLLFSGQAGTAELAAQALKQGLELPLLSKPVRPKELLEDSAFSSDAGGVSGYSGLRACAFAVPPALSRSAFRALDGLR